MTIQQARDNFALNLAENAYLNMCTTEEMKIAISALEKQIPKKPIDNRYPWAICPNCGGSVNLKNIQEHIHNEEASHCEHCGQALDWSDTK